MNAINKHICRVVFGLAMLLQTWGWVEVVWTSEDWKWALGQFQLAIMEHWVEKIF